MLVPFAGVVLRREGAVSAKSQRSDSGVHRWQLAQRRPARLAGRHRPPGRGAVDSFTTLALVSFLEQSFGIQLDPESVNAETFRTVCDIVSLVESKTTC